MMIAIIIYLMIVSSSIVSSFHCQQHQVKLLFCSFWNEFDCSGNIWTIIHMDKLGRKFFLCLSMILSGATAFLIYIVNSSIMNLVLSCLFGAVSTMGFNSLDCLSVEVFPTHLRSSAMAVTLVSARLGAILGAYFNRALKTPTGMVSAIGQAM